MATIKRIEITKLQKLKLTILCVTLCVTLVMLRDELQRTKLLSGRTYKHMHSFCLRLSSNPVVASLRRKGTLKLFFVLLHGRKYIVCQIFIMAMQDVINKMKGTALGVAEYLTPVLKVLYAHVNKREWRFLFYL